LPLFFHHLWNTLALIVPRLPDQLVIGIFQRFFGRVDVRVLALIPF
jgi:hypothetical protein